MANTINRVGNVIELSSIDSDWLYSETLPYPWIKVLNVQFNGGDADDVCVIKNGSASGPPMFNSKVEDGDYDQKYKLQGAKLQPFLDFSAGTYSSGATVEIVLDM